MKKQNIEIFYQHKLLIVNYASHFFYIPFLYIITFKICYEARLIKRDRSFFSRSDRPAIF